MNADSIARLIEARLLTMLRPDEGLRFVFERARDQKRMSVALDGFGPDPESLNQRVGAILAASRTHGFEFLRYPTEAHSGSIELNNTTSLAWLEISPAGKEVRHLNHKVMGFVHHVEDQSVPFEPLCVPDLLAAGLVRMVDYPVSLLANEGALMQMEIQFTRITLSEHDAERVANALAEYLNLKRSIPGVDFGNNPMSAYLAMWWRARSGWDLRCRILHDTSRPLPNGVIEMLGREIFGTDCIFTDRDEKAESLGDRSLAQGYPDGWSFPAMLPPSHEQGTLSAGTLHNRQLPELPDEGVLIGMADHHEVRLPIHSRDRHLYVVGGTGTGKTTLLKRLILDDLERNEGLVLLDPHGDLFHEIREVIPARRKSDLIAIDPASRNRVIAFNVLDFPRDRFEKRRAEFLVGETIRFFRETWDCPEAFGPLFELYFRNALRLLIHQKQVHTFMEFERLFTDREFRKQLLETCTDESIRNFWSNMAEKAGGEISLANVTPYISSKVSVLTQSGFLSELIGQAKDRLRLESRMNRGGIILVNLNKGQLGAHESRFLGILLTMQIFAAGLKRSTMPPDQRRPVNIYIDEFQNFVSENVCSMLSEARKFGLRLNLANQTLSQLGGGRGRQELLETVLGNVGNLLAFRLGVPDAERLRPFLKPFTPEQIQQLPNFHALVRLLDQEGPIGPLIMKTLKA